MKARERVAAFITKRERLRINKANGNPRPWTPDPILQKYRFCNVRREDDRVTKWLEKHWREPYSEHINLTVAMVLARMINWPPTLELIGFPERWNTTYKKYVRNVMDHEKAKGNKVWSSAYVVTTCGRKMDKTRYVLYHVCQQVDERDIYPVDGDTLESFWKRLRTVDGLGAGFIAAQVVADLKNTYGNCLMVADDFSTWAVPGPGSRRGVNRYLGEGLTTKLTDDAWLMALHRIKKEVKFLIPTYLKDSMCMQDWQNVMCEFDKYERTRLGEGRPRQNYTPARNNDTG